MRITARVKRCKVEKEKYTLAVPHPALHQRLAACAKEGFAKPLLRGRNVQSAL